MQAIFIFRRDLRLEDNLALIQAAAKASAILPVFIFDPRQLAPHPYRSEPAIPFLLNSLSELDKEIRKYSQNGLLTFHGIAEELLPEIIKASAAKAVFCSRDYSLFSIKRDESLKKICNGLGAEFFNLANILLNEPENINTTTGKKYTIFTPFFKSASKTEVTKPEKIKNIKFASLSPQTNLPFFSIQEAAKRYSPNSDGLLLSGGRQEGLRLISEIEHLADYNEQRNLPALSATSRLSAHNKFGTVSIREVHHKVTTCFSASHTLCTELYWRDFFTHIGFNFPHVFKGAFNKQLDKLEWEENDEYLLAWQEARTGFPIVDAGMRELNQTGFMHNRVRMIVASFLTKDLLLDWHHGERYFARKLLDYDPAVNNGNWQWAASTGCDAQPYFRIFNPWLQSEKFDPQAEYIKRWIPELEKYSAKQIHNWHKESSHKAGYPAPIVDHAEQKAKALRLFA